MAVESWEREKNTIIYNQEVYNKTENKWLREVRLPLKPEPSMQEAYKVFSQIVTTNTNTENGMVTIAVEHVSPYIAKQWVSWLIQDINKTMKQRDVVEANKSTQFLMSQLESTKIADIRTVLYKLVEEQAKTIMFASVRDEYVFKTIDPAIVPEQKFKPKRALMLILGIMLGIILSVFCVLVSYFAKNKTS